jgi:basic membrane protein A and related proteins
VLSAVGGKKIPSVDNWIAGYRAGAKRANPRIKVLIDYSGDFPPSVAPKCKEIALRHISQGAKAVFQVAGGCGLGALEAAKEKKRWGIGVDADQAYLGKHILTSGVKRVDNAVFNFFREADNGTLRTGRDLVFNLKNGGQDVGKISTNCKCPAEVKKMNALKPLIIKGKIKIPSTLEATT